MQIRDFEWILAVEKAGSFSKAAARLFVPQPALSRQIARIEREAGIDLFVRTNRGVQPSEAGRLFLAYAHAITEQYDALQEELVRLRSPICGRLVVGCNPVMGQPRYLAELMRRMDRCYPGIELAFHYAPSPLLLHGAQEGSVDCAFVTERHCLQFAPEHPALRWQVMHPIEYYALLTAKHPLADRRVLRIQDLAGQPLVLLRRQLIPLSYAMILSAFEQAGVRPTAVVQAENFGELSLLVRSGKGVAVVSTQIQGADTILIPLQDQELHSVRVLAWMETNQNPCLDAFRHMAQQFRQSLPAD